MTSLCSGTRTFYVLFAALVVLACLGLFFPDRQQLPKSVPIAPYVNYSYNGDSSEYAILVATFPGGFKQHPMRVLRPLYPFLGSLVYQPLRVLKPFLPADFCGRIADVMARNGGEQTWSGMDVRDVVLAWAALIVVNFALYTAALLVIVHALQRIFPPGIAVLLALYPALHRDTLDYLLVPSAEPFNFLIPGIFLYTAMVVWPSKRAGYATALVQGLGMLGKGLAFVIGNWLYEHLFVRNWRNAWRPALLCLMIFAAPAAIYLVMLRVAGVTAYNHEVMVYRQFIWNADYLREGKIAEIPMRWLTGLGTHLCGVAMDWAVPLAMCALLTFRREIRVFAVDRALQRHLIVYTFCAAAFWVVGSVLYFRLDICYYPPIIVLLGALTARKLVRPHQFLLGGLLLQAVVFAVVNQFL